MSVPKFRSDIMQICHHVGGAGKPDRYWLRLKLETAYVLLSGPVPSRIDLFHYAARTWPHLLGLEGRPDDPFAVLAPFAQSRARNAAWREFALLEPVVYTHSQFIQPHSNRPRDLNSTFPGGLGDGVPR